MNRFFQTVSFLLFLLALFITACYVTPKETSDIAQDVLQIGNLTYRGGLKDGRYHGYGVLTRGDSVLYAGRWDNGRRQGAGMATDEKGRTIIGKWNADTLVSGFRHDTLGVYEGSFNKKMQADGHGIYRESNGNWYEGHWLDDQRSGQGFAFTEQNKLKVGEWKADKYRGERITYTTERIYGIDISKYQHVIRRRVYPIHWSQLRITHLGTASKKAIHGSVNYPISFIYIKSTEGVSITNPFYRADYRQARAHGFHVGTYHFFSIYTSAEAQAAHFLRVSHFSKGDFPPVLDVEPTPRQIEQMGGATILFARIRTWMKIVERRVGVRPVLYVSQLFVNRYLSLAPDIKKNYDVWIARYGEYKPDVHLVYWQLCADGRVSGIRGSVDISVFNGYQDVFDDYLRTKRISAR